MKTYIINQSNYDEEAIVSVFDETAWVSLTQSNNGRLVRSITFYDDNAAKKFKRIFGDMIKEDNE